jgi:hypothetical protein
MVANYVATNAVIFPSSLGRNLSASTNTTINLVEPGTVYRELSYQTDLRESKEAALGRWRFEGLLDLFNVFHANTVFQCNST